MHWQVLRLYILHAIIVYSTSLAKTQVLNRNQISTTGDGREHSLSPASANGLAMGAKTSLATIPRKRPHLKKRLNIIQSSTPINSTTIGTTYTHPYNIVLTDMRAIIYPHLNLEVVVNIMESFYEAIAFFLLDVDSLPEEHDLVLRMGEFELEFYCVAEYLSLLAVKAVVRRLSQMLQNGLTGFVAGEVVDVTTAVRTLFAFGVALRLEHF